MKRQHTGRVKTKTRNQHSKTGALSLTIALGAGFLIASTAYAAETCDQWLTQTGAVPGTSACLNICTNASVGLATYMCPSECPAFCDDSGDKTPAQASAYAREASLLGGAAAALPVVGIAYCPWSGPFAPGCAAGFGAAAGVMGVAGAYYGVLSADPPDSNFTSIGLPVTLSVQPVPTTAPYNQAVAIAMNALISNTNQQQALEQAVMTATNRISGALNAGDAESATMQRIIESQYALDLSKLLGNYVGVLTNVGTALVQAGYPSTITAANVQAYQASVAANGLPPYEVQALQQLGVTSDTISTITQQVATLNPNAFAGSVPAVFSSTSVKATVQSGVNALVAVATNNGVTALASGQTISGTLAFKNASGNSVVISISAKGFASAAAGTFTLSDKSTTTPQNVTGQITGASLENGSVIVDGSYTDANGSPQTFTAVATIRGTSATINNVTLGLSSGYAAAGSVVAGSLKIS